jgi:hypothetical protein
VKQQCYANNTVSVQLYSLNIHINCINECSTVYMSSTPIGANQTLNISAFRRIHLRPGRVLSGEL